MYGVLAGDSAGLSAAQRLDALADAERRIAALQAFQYRLMAALDAESRPSVPGEDDKAWVREDIACALRISPASAGARLADARKLTSALPQTLAALERGELSGLHARALLDETHGLTQVEAAAVQDRVLSAAAGQTVGAFRRCVARAVLACAPRSQEQVRVEDVARRRVWLRPCGPGTSELWALLPHEGAAALMTAVTALANATQPTGTGTSSDASSAADQRTADQRRADALVQLGLDALAGQVSTRLPTQQRIRPAVQVTVALSTLLGVDEQPGDLDGVGPIPAALARQLAPDPSGTWRRLVTDEHGRLVDYGRSTYRPPTALAEHVMARDRTCRFPHCTRTARHCDLDHRTRWADGGHTNAANLQPLCRRHHRLKDELGWQPRLTGDGDTTWTSPTGHRYTARAATYPPDTTTEPTTTAPTTKNPTDLDPDPPPF